MRRPDIRRRPWVMRMRWVDLLFAHWPMDPDALRGVIPPSLELDLFDGRAYLGIVPFRMEDVGMRGLPAPPVVGAFPELNVRTYVRHRGRGGVWFLSLDAANRAAVEGARAAFHLPYFEAEMAVGRVREVIDYRSVRIDRRGAPARFEGRYRPTGPVEPAVPGSLEAWLTDRPRLFAVDGDGRVLRTEIAHRAWPLQPAVARIEVDTMAAAHGLTLPDEPPHLRFASRLDVVAWWPVPDRSGTDRPTDP
jgi:uncharacterized protein YqjF (DUF2071 family)